MDGCPHCANIKKMLNEENINYDERNINDYSDEYKQFVKVTNNDFLPAFTLLNLDDVDDPKYEFLTPDDGFQDLNEAVDKVKKFLL